MPVITVSKITDIFIQNSKVGGIARDGLKRLGGVMLLSTYLGLSGCVQVPETIGNEATVPLARSGEAAANVLDGEGAIDPANGGEYTNIPVAEDKDAILGTIDAFFEALATGNATRLEQLVSRDAINITSFPEEPGRPVRYGKTRAIAQSMREGTAPKIEEPYWAPIVLQRKSLAMVWAPYEVWINERLAHCGIDLFTLTLQKTTWQIDSIHWTQEPSACEELWPNGRSLLRPNMFNNAQK